MRLDTAKEISELTKNYKAILEEHGVDIKKDEFTVIQEYDDGNIISISVEEDEYDGKRKVKMLVNDATFILPKKSGTLDAFEE